MGGRSNGFPHSRRAIVAALAVEQRHDDQNKNRSTRDPSRSLEKALKGFFLNFGVHFAVFVISHG